MENIQRGFHNAFILLLLQLVVTMCTFTANYLIARFMQKKDYGFGNVNMMLLITIINFFLKDALRKTVQKKAYVINPEKLQKLQQINNCSEDMLRKRSFINFGWIGVIWTVLISNAAIIFLYLYFGEGHSSNEAKASYIYAACCCLEAISEPFNFKYIMENDFKIRVSSESAGSFVRSVVLLLFAFKGYGIMAFPFAQIGYVMTSTVSFFLLSYLKERANTEFKFMDFFPRKMMNECGNSFYVLSEHTKEAVSFTVLSSLKLILTEGEKVFIVVLGALSVDAKGDYSLISNFASVLTRFVFLPLEEAAFNLFGNECKGGEDKNFLMKAMRIVTSITLLAITLAYYLSVFTIRTLYSEKWVSSNTTSMLFTYCIYLLFCAINGLSEAYATAKAKSKEMYGLTMMLVVNSIIYINACYFMKGVGVLSLIFANMVNMGFRILVNFYYIYKKESVEFMKIVVGCLPHLYSIIYLIFANCVLYLARRRIGEDLKLAIVGAGLAAVYAALLLKDNYRLFIPKRKGN